MNDGIKHARSIAVTLLNHHPVRTPELIRTQVKLAIQTTRLAGLPDVDVESLIAQLMHEGNVFVPDATMIDDPHDHLEWLPARRGSIQWNFWARYKTFLEQEKSLPEPVVSSLDKLTDEILGKLEEPQRSPRWDCRGMVVGSVQSGKTANYCGLICKAIDAGYKLIVVLAGMHDSLRSQTQYRLDEGVLGRDSQKERHLDQASSLIGVGKLFGKLLPIHTLTSSLDDGDFNESKADTGVMLGGDPVVLVIKKNVNILDNLLGWVLHGGDETEPRKKTVRDIPILMIDDEADNASINTRDRRDRKLSNSDVTTINGQIRKVLNAFEKCAYVGYTATPFGNIFINPEAETIEHGEDLFPRSFILNVSPPSNYVSPSLVFGLDGDPDAGIEPKEALPLFRAVNDHEAVFLPKHKKDLVVGELPKSLTHALHCFVLACAARRARGGVQIHNSMLVHVTRFVDAQTQVARLLQEQVDSIRRRLSLGEGDKQKTLLSTLRDIWMNDFEKTTAKVRALLPQEELPDVTWDEVAKELPESAARLEIKQINGHATDALDYVAHRQGWNVIAVGGDKLSRGLTLEGLSISYFLRTSQMYDTLMQMGRWFGYRPGYLDLCRLFTTEELRLWYRHVALAEVELRREFDRMKSAGLTPKRYGLRVRENPDGLLVTALNKMSHARTQRLSYAGRLVQTAHFDTSTTVVKNNARLVANFLRSLGGLVTAKKDNPSAYIWKDISATQLLEDLLKEFSVCSEGWRFQKPELMKFIAKQESAGELTNWTIALIRTRGTHRYFDSFSRDVGVVERKPEDGTWKIDEIPQIYAASNSNIQSPSHQALDLAEIHLDRVILADLLAKCSVDEESRPVFGPEEQEVLRRCCSSGETLASAAAALTVLRRSNKGVSSEGVSIHGEVARNVRPKTHGLLLIYPVVPKGGAWPKDEPPFMGLVFSFPSSHTARAVNYKVNRVWQSTFHDEDYTDGE